MTKLVTWNSSRLLYLVTDTGIYLIQTIERMEGAGTKTAIYAPLILPLHEGIMTKVQILLTFIYMSVNLKKWPTF